MPSLEHAGITAQYTESGDGEPVVFLHAGASSSRQWRKITPRLENNFRLLAPDLIGFAQTPPWAGTRELTHDDQAALVRSLIEATCDQPVHLVGHSYGGATAVRLWLAMPTLVRSLVLIEPIMMPLLEQVGEQALFGEYQTFAHRFVSLVDADEPEAAMEFFIDHRNGPGTWASTGEESRAKLLAVARQTADAFRSNLNNPTTLSDCRSIAAPTLVICGEETTTPERRVSLILKDAIPGCHYEIVEGAGHMSPFTHPDDVAVLIEAHLGGVSGEPD
jgi:pimeloyl-ACP methyl ester carboxylesterase